MFPEIQNYLQEIENDDKREANPHKECASSFITKSVNDCKISEVSSHQTLSW